MGRITVEINDPLLVVCHNPDGSITIKARDDTEQAQVVLKALARDLYWHITGQDPPP